MPPAAGADAPCRTEKFWPGLSADAPRRGAEMDSWGCAKRCGAAPGVPVAEIVRSSVPLDRRRKRADVRVVAELEASYGVFHDRC